MLDDFDIPWRGQSRAYSSGSFMSPISRRVREIKEYSEIAEIGDIARRYFAMNAFDGVLTMIGILMGNFAAGVADAQVVVSTGLATLVTISISGLWGAYFTEAAERKKELDDLGSYVIADLNDTKIGKASRFATITITLVDAFVPSIAGIIVLLPFIICSTLGIVQQGYYFSLGMALVTLFGLGGFLGMMSRENVILAGIKMVGAGVVSILLSMALDVTH